MCKVLLPVTLTAKLLVAYHLTKGKSDASVWDSCVSDGESMKNSGGPYYGERVKGKYG